MRLINRMIPLTGGDILLGGVSILKRDPVELRRDIGYVIQQIGLFPHLTIGENIYLGNERQFTKFGLVQWRVLYEAAARQLEKVKVDIDPRTRADVLSFAARQMVELAKAGVYDVEELSTRTLSSLEQAG